MKLRNKKTGSILEINDEERNLYSLLKKTSYLKDWEEYTPKEPLIKDEKIRKAVRAWAEALDAESCSFRADHDIFDFIAIGASCLRFDMSDGWGTYELEDIPNGWHTIAELCGEEEE